MRPMLATRGSRVPSGPEWTHEVKWDGMRVIAEIADDRPVVLSSRRGNDAAVSFPELQALRTLAAGPVRQLVLDGEVVALIDGRPSFATLAERMHVARPARAAELAATIPVTYLIFDLLALDGVDLTREPLSRRRGLLETAVADGPCWQVPASYSDGESLLDATREQGLEGVVSKRLDSRYESGQRSAAWLKFPHRASSSWVVGGWRLQTDSQASLGSLLVGEPTANGLLYRGRVGSGIGHRLGEALREVLVPLQLAASPFADPVPAADAHGARWVEPLLVVEVESLGVSPAGRLRQPSLRGLRPDLTPTDLE